MEGRTQGCDEGSEDELVQIEIPVELADYLSAGGLPRDASGVQKFCRVCLHAAGADMSCIFSGPPEDQLAFMLTTFTRIQMFSGDGLPSKVCRDCKELIMQCYSLKLKCERSDAALRAFLQGDIIYNVKSEGDNDNVKTDYDNGREIYLESLDEDTNDCAGGYDGNEMVNSDIKVRIKAEELTDHLLDHISNGGKSSKRLQKKPTFVCDVCDKRFKDLEKLSEHIVKTHMVDNNTGKCGMCGKNCKSERGLRQHMIYAHGDENEAERPFKCAQCESVFLSQKDLNIHSAVHSTGTPRCRECHKEFTTMIQLKRHIKRHMDDKPHKCDLCTKTFSEIFALYRHQRSHFGTAVEKKHMCTFCGKKFAEKSALTVHTRQHTGERPYVCIECGKDFLSARLLNSHMRTHSECKPYKCKHCDKSFRHTATLATHRRTHTGERPYVCSVCGKTFIQSSNLTLHLRVHSGERPYKCGTCSRSFTSWSTMKSHQRIHTGDRPYSCKICGQRFARMDMKVHMRRHTDDRPFVCTLCHKSFFTSVRLNEHSRLHSGVKPFECGLCGIKLAAKSSLQKHMKKHRLGKKKVREPKVKSHNLIGVEFGQNDSTEGSALQICDYVDGTETVIDQSGELKEEVQEGEVSVVIPNLTEGIPLGVEIVGETVTAIPDAALDPRGRRLNIYTIQSGHIIKTVSQNIIIN